MKFDLSRLDKKITLATVKAFVAAAGDKVESRCDSSFDGMADCVQRNENPVWHVGRDEERAYMLRHTLGVKAIYLVGSSRDSFSKFEDETHIGIRIYNCCGSSVVAVRKAPAPVAPVVRRRQVDTATEQDLAVTVTENKEKGGLEIRFKERPEATTIEALKAQGWRWSRFAGCWWKKATADARAFASIFSVGQPA